MNHLPFSPIEDLATFRKMRIVPFETKFFDSEREIDQKANKRKLDVSKKGDSNEHTMCRPAKASKLLYQ